MNQRPKQEEFEAVADLMVIESSFVEKDWFVTQVVAALAAFRYEEFEFIFTGGTALSKAHGLIKRFSEDVDFRVIAPQEQQSRKPLSKFKHVVLAHMRASGFAIEDEHVKAKDENRLMGTSIYLFRNPITALGGARNPHVLRVHSGFCAPSALSSGFSRQLIEVPLWLSHLITPAIFPKTKHCVPMCR